MNTIDPDQQHDIVTRPPARVTAQSRGCAAHPKPSASRYGDRLQTNCITLSSHSNCRPGEAMLDMLYPAPKRRSARSVEPVANQLPITSDENELSANDCTDAGISAIQEIADSTLRHILQNVFPAFGTAVDAGIAVLPLLQKLSDTDTAITQLLRRQPDFQAAAKSHLDRALQQAFPSVSPAIDADRIYVTRYEENQIASSAQESRSERKIFSSRTLTQALWESINGMQEPAVASTSRTAFFCRPDNVDAANLVVGMQGQQQLLKFNKILQDASAAAACKRYYQQALRQFWSIPDKSLGPGQTPATWLARKYGQQRLTETELRIGDGTLTATDKQWLMAAMENCPAANKPGAFSLSVQAAGKMIALPGSVAFTRSPSESPDTANGPILLALAGQGLMKFASASAYRQHWQQLLADTTQRNVLSAHVASTDRATLDGVGNSTGTIVATITAQIINGPIFPHLIQSQLQRQIADVASAALPDVRQARVFPAILEQTADLRASFDLHGVRHKREQLLLQKFLEPASSDDKKSWFEECAQYRRALQKTKTSGLPGMHQYLDPDFLTRYASNYLRDQIRQDLKLEVTPDQIIVTTYELSLAYTSRGDFPAPPNARPSEKIPHHSTLTELALANTRMLDQSWGDEFPVKDAQGNPLPQLTRDYLTRTIRAANIGQRYQQFLQSHLLDSPEGQAREDAYAEFLKARLQLDVREAKIGGDISSESARWVLAAMTSVPVEINQRTVQARHLEIDQNKLNDVLVFATPQPFTYLRGLTPVTTHADTGSPSIVVYLPGAPNGRFFRTYDNRAQMNQDLINNPVMREYLLERIDLPNRNAVKRLLNDKVSDFYIKDTLIPEDFLRAMYRTQVAHILADAAERTVTNDETERQAWWDKFNMGLDIAGIFLPVKLEIPLSLMRAGHALYSANAARRRDHDEQAVSEFVNAINLLVSAAADSAGRLSIPSQKHAARSSIHTTNVAARDTPTSASSTISISLPPVPSVPAGMRAVQIDGQSHFYWNSTNSTVRYRDLFVWDPAHTGQLKSAGYGAPDEKNIWKKITPLQGGGNMQNRRPVPESTPAAITKVTSSEHQTHVFKARINAQEIEVVYDFDKNAFRPKFHHGDQPNDTWYVLRDNAMHEISDGYRATDPERQATLSALGIDLQLPLNFVATSAANAKPIPRVIYGIWVGDQLIPTALAENLEHNARIAATGSGPYQTKLYLTIRHPEALKKNFKLLRDSAPSVRIVPLENSRFYREFGLEHQGRYFSQYQAALNGNGGVASNYAAAVDILRYRLLFRNGGLYMDIDDRLFTIFSDTRLNVAPDGLALGGLVRCKTLDMDTQYNNSIFGAQANNPTLNAISEESYQRFLQNRDLYSDPRPRKSTHTASELSSYMKRISHVTGPGVFNDVIDEQLPAMHQMREAVKLRTDNNISLPEQMETLIDAWEERRLPLRDVMQIGNEHSWHEHR